MYIGMDDTDSKNGMCTTYLMSELVNKIHNIYDIIGFPKLVRLNPNIPWKTRGNGALSLKVGYGYGRKIRIGAIGNETIYGYEKARNISIDKKKLYDLVDGIVNRYARFEDPMTNPGFVISEKKLSERYYWRAVREVVDINYMVDELQINGIDFKGYKNRRGLIGAAASISWRGRRKTYELITYRETDKWNLSSRSVDATSVKEVELKIRGNFNTYDLFNDRSCIAPHTKCPILYGVRATSYKPLYDVLSMISSEPVSRWLIYETNQGTDDHIINNRTIKDISPFSSSRLKVTVESPPFVGRGGDVFVKVKDASSSITAAFYKESAPMTSVAANLIPGDELILYGSMRSKGSKEKTLNIEKMIIKSAADLYKKYENPVCPICNKHMKSAGNGEGYRCRKCRTKTMIPVIKKVDRIVKENIYEPAASRRRHLSMPAKMMTIN
ncbi:MAG: tRNA(Ile)(2)-agmatinylcytidine synthase [Candidatus Thermoplasmatota archaeon]|jgi:tRNA(Ile2)-agmatinylcytidine synthase|nr:tRNA(Ile)(2)-agmatinylcytidine synthase [Candidatus Thermoplasmatota archaeon]MCL5962753.1 tRNA(Ile)(2)-agmatinylcytidine synthase [Candidatus Thermoplasmatota archaeon]